MILTPLKPSKLRQTILNLSGICLGCFIVALGFVLFINPYKLVPGGVFGLSIVLHQLFPTIQVGTFGYMLEVPILLLSALCLGSKVGLRTLVAAFAAPFFMNLLSTFCYPDELALRLRGPMGKIAEADVSDRCQAVHRKKICVIKSLNLKEKILIYKWRMIC